MRNFSIIIIIIIIIVIIIIIIITIFTKNVVPQVLAKALYKTLSQ